MGHSHACAAGRVVALAEAMLVCQLVYACGNAVVGHPMLAQLSHNSCHR